jgi:hypothetical protein
VVSEHIGLNVENDDFLGLMQEFYHQRDQYLDSPA